MRAYVLLAGFLCLAQIPARAGEPVATEETPTLEICMAAVAKGRAAAEALPADHLSRYFAERLLLQALTEANGGEYDDCVEFAERAETEAREQYHVLRPGDTFKVLRADEMPAPAR